MHALLFLATATLARSIGNGFLSATDNSLTHEIDAAIGGTHRIVVSDSSAQSPSSPVTLRYLVTDAVIGAQNPWGVSEDDEGGFLVTYFADCTVFRYAGPGLGGRIVAGRSTFCSHTGDGAPSLDAELNHPTGIAAYSPTDFLIGEVRDPTSGFCV